MQYFIKVKFRRLLAVIWHCRARTDYKIRKHYSTHFGRYCLLSTNHRESIYFAIKKSQAPKIPRTDTILPEHLLAHTLITHVYSHYCIWSFCHQFPCHDVLITSTRIEFSNHENKQSLTQTFYLLLAATLSM